MSNKLIDLVGITKSFDGETVLDDLNLYIRENEFLLSTSDNHNANLPSLYMMHFDSHG